MSEKKQKIKARAFEIVAKAEDGDLASKIFDRTIMALIVLSVISIILESFSNIFAKYYTAFRVFEIITVVVFSIEYLLRIWTADLLYPDAKHPRLKYVFSLMALFDLLAILPFYLPFFSADLRFLRMVRLFRMFRLFRVFKLGRYLDALQIIVKVVKRSGPQLTMSVVICFFVMLFSSIIMYSVENPVQPQQFPNVISSLWWAMCTITTVGYGDVYPITSVGRFFASLISLVGIGIIAIPTGIIASGFNQIISGERYDKYDFTRTEEASVEHLNEDELLLLEARIASRLREYGYTTVITSGPVLPEKTTDEKQEK